MLIYIGNSRWTNSGRCMAKHACNEDRQALCGKGYRNGVLEIYEGKKTDITCDKCKRLVRKLSDIELQEIKEKAEKVMN